MTDDNRADPSSSPASEAPTKAPDRKMPAAGPHARPELTNPDATPGTGSLPDPEDETMGGVSS
jgi:hypothetical protein